MNKMEKEAKMLIAQSPRIFRNETGCLGTVCRRLCRAGGVPVQSLLNHARDASRSATGQITAGAFVGVGGRKAEDASGRCVGGGCEEKKAEVVDPKDAAAGGVCGAAAVEE
ncbi:uncharacterized protein MONOS_11397 [Monocercomonoides exilis]|uniref:uncharacterized protein n=1 Tax=Monocercomonoides exilis TaxID=2049356 RepID=UPI00355A5A18|nr:hypothetical protein MONOS_11397 [Monocercomonoides exilis]|eukprot:MONOS_11397.1-p1 / transcript=MONOS_11397.1 / gene=MONOS_11397 / organism=Monocercomonoides_exilis_PA203 / gene_product=unspecified product / transcript_product=unspecified product / location=Mono_scaffold00569:19553-19956(+) / protein_length=111 / sequence_SO=supercontig / SO=protein_coding / is_pseudo=false